MSEFKVGDKVKLDNGILGGDAICTVEKIVDNEFIDIKSMRSGSLFRVTSKEIYRAEESRSVEKSINEYKHYQYSYKGIKLDPYRILSVYGVTCPAIQHAIKKLLRAGNSVKDLEQDIKEVIDTLKRKLEMIEEDRGLVQREDYSETK